MINYIEGDATVPNASGNKIIVHICNDIGGWGKGFVMAISRRWKSPEQKYREWHASGQDFALGKVQFVQVEDDLWIANVIGQHKLRKDKESRPPIRYEAVRLGMRAVGKKAEELNASVHMPRIGCGLAGGTWDQIEPILIEELTETGIRTTVYDFK